MTVETMSAEHGGSGGFAGDRSDNANFERSMEFIEKVYSKLGATMGLDRATSLNVKGGGRGF